MNGGDMLWGPNPVISASTQSNLILFAGAPRSAVNGFPLHLLTKSSPQKGSLRFCEEFELASGAFSQVLR